MSSFKLRVAASTCIAAIGVVAAIASLGVHAGTSQQVGPWVAPFFASALLVAMGLVLLFQATTGRWCADADGENGTLLISTPNLAWLAAGVGADVILIGTFGFVPASAILFAATTRAFGSRAWLANLAAGLAFAVVLELLFVRLLGIDLGSGLFSFSM